jgi:hypothetical protein
MDIDSLVETQKNTGTGGNSELKEAQFKFESGKPVIIKLDPKQIEVVHEIWLNPSDNLPEGKPKDTKYVFVLKRKINKDSSESNLFAKVLGNPDEWKVGNNKKPWHGYFSDGIYEFTYSKEKGPDGFKTRIYKHLTKPEHKEFFQKFAFEGKPFALDKYPKASVNIRYTANIQVVDNAFCASKKSLMWTNFSNGIFQKLMDMHVEGYHLDKTWFKITRIGEDQNTDYTVLPLPLDKSTELTLAYGEIDTYSKPEIGKNSILASNYYVWKYLQSYIQYADTILKSNYSEIFKKDYDEHVAKYQENAAAQGNDPGIPSEVHEESSAAHYDGGAMNDDDIPF